MQVSARGDYAVRAAVSLASTHPSTVSAQSLADGEGLPHKFLEAVLADLRRGGVVTSVRGADGGYRLSRDPAEISVGAVLRAVDGPLAGVRGQRPEEVSYDGASAHLPELWIAVRAAVRNVLDEVTLAQVATGRLPARVRRLIGSEGAWEPR